MINKLDPARKGMVFGMMTEDEQEFFKEAPVDAVQVWTGYRWAPVGSPKWSNCTAYWTYWERPPAPPSDKKEELPDPPSPEHEVFDFRWYQSSMVGDRAVRAVYALPRKKGATPASLPPAAKEGWNHSELCLVHYPGNPEEQVCEGWSVAYYHWEPPFASKPLWVDHLSNRKNPDFWWELPDVPKA